MTGLNVDYCLAFLRQESNQYLDVPPAVARALPPSIRELIGYTRVHPSLGYVGAYTRPEDVLDAWPAVRVDGVSAPQLAAAGDEEAEAGRRRQQGRGQGQSRL